MTRSVFRFFTILIAWGSIYPLTLIAIFLFDSNSRQELLWQIKFESHYLLIRQLIFDYLHALPITFIWLAAIIAYKLICNTGHAKLATWLLLSYPILLAAILFMLSTPDIFWQMAITGWLLNWLFVGGRK